MFATTNSEFGMTSALRPRPHGHRTGRVLKSSAGTIIVCRACAFTQTQWKCCGAHSFMWATIVVVSAVSTCRLRSGGAVTSSVYRLYTSRRTSGFIRSGTRFQKWGYFWGYSDSWNRLSVDRAQDPLDIPHWGDCNMSTASMMLDWNYQYSPLCSESCKPGRGWCSCRVI